MTVMIWSNTRDAGFPDCNTDTQYLLEEVWSIKEVLHRPSCVRGRATHVNKLQKQEDITAVDSRKTPESSGALRSVKVIHVDSKKNKPYTSRSGRKGKSSRSGASSIAKETIDESVSSSTSLHQGLHVLTDRL